MLEQGPAKSFSQIIRPSLQMRAGCFRIGCIAATWLILYGILFSSYHLLAHLLWDSEIGDGRILAIMARVLCFCALVMGNFCEITASIPSLEHSLCLAWALLVLTVAESGLCIASNEREIDGIRVFRTRAFIVAGLSAVAYKTYEFSRACSSWVRTVRAINRRSARTKHSALSATELFDKVVDVTFPFFALLVMVSIMVYVRRPSLNVGPCEDMQGKTGM
jgi:hypothetical protein